MARGIHEPVNLQEKIIFHTVNLASDLSRRRNKAWSGLSVLILTDDTAALPKRYRINYYVLIFIGLLLIFLPSFAFVLAVRNIFEKSNPANYMAKRRSLLSSMMLLNDEKKTVFIQINKQILTFRQISNRHQDSQRSINLTLFGEIEENRQPSGDTFTRNLKNIQELQLRSRFLRNAAYYSVHFIWNRIYLHHLFPQGRPLKPGISEITALFGWRPNPFGTGSSEYHSGVDFKAAHGTPIIATAPGVVIKAINESNDGYGLNVKLHHGFGYTTLYAHCSELLVEEGDFVERGQVIGKVGASGRVTGSHVHYELKIGKDFEISPWRKGYASDPMQFVKLK